jgi:hypothetical protein
MIEVTSDHIAQLNDTDLRTLIGRLCEADAVRNGKGRRGVTWGGHQTAADGGLDVRVDLSGELAEESFILRPKAGFQVKAMDMPKSAISEEMRPGGVLRTSIREVLECGGADVTP